MKCTLYGVTPHGSLRWGAMLGGAGAAWVHGAGEHGIRKGNRLVVMLSSATKI